MWYIHAQFVARSADVTHRSRKRHLDQFTVLESPKKKSSLDTPGS